MQEDPPYVCGAMKFAWGSDTGGQQDSITVMEAEEREGRAPLDRPPAERILSSEVDTAVSIEREVVSGHAYAILAPQAEISGRCGKGKPTNLSVDGVVNP
jgi:hypothetical protein